MLLQNILYRCKESELGVWPNSEHSETSESIVNLKILHMLCSDVASNAALCVQFRNHSDHMELFINGRFRGEPAEPGGWQVGWASLESNLQVGWCWSLAFGRASGSGNPTRWVQTEPNLKPLFQLNSQTEPAGSIERFQRCRQGWIRVKMLHIKLDFAKNPKA